MSIWKRKHGMSPVVEKSLIVLAACYGFVAIYFSSLEPLVAPETYAVNNMPVPVTLDIDQWQRFHDLALGCFFGAPPGWLVRRDSDGSVVMARTQSNLDAGRETIKVEKTSAAPRQKVEDLAAAEFAGRKPALYDVTVDGLPGLFAIDFENGRVVRQVVYVKDGGEVRVFRGGAINPAVFSAFVSTVRFLGTAKN